MDNPQYKPGDRVKVQMPTQLKHYGTTGEAYGRVVGIHRSHYAVRLGLGWAYDLGLLENEIMGMEDAQ